MRKVPLSTVWMGTLILLLSTAFFVLPSMGLDVFLSPDETANAVSARTFASTGSFRVAGSVVAVPWAHPRSFTASSAGLLPVSFLGMPLLLGVVGKIVGSLGMIALAPLLAISVLFPLWSFTRPWGRMGQFATVIGWMTFPTVVLYANRGFFPNLPVVCLAIWSAWLAWRSRSTGTLVASGLLAGLALVIRPTEVIWLLPWIFVARLQGRGVQKRLDRNIKDAALFFAPMLAVCLFGAWLGWRTYGTWFTAGYQLRDAMPDVSAAVSSAAVRASWFESWPFGFHPRNVWLNIALYLVAYLFPWFLIAISAIALAWKKKGSKHLIALAAWTVISLTLLYGQSIYQDHVRVNAVTLANSFLRYLLPISVIAAASLGWCATQLLKRGRRYGSILAAPIIVLTGIFGYWTALTRDDEGIVQNKTELMKYAEVRARTTGALSPGTIILSDRSDKIFFPLFRAVSPLPSKELIKTLAHESVALYLRTQTPEQLREWKAEGMDLQPIFTVGNESLYSARVAL